MEKTQILVVEDEDTSARLIEMTLKSWGYVVPAVIPSGEEAIKKAGEVHPDLVLMDIRLKGDMDGVQAAEEIYTRFNIPVVYLTAYADNKILQRAKITEPYGYILKPFQQRELHTTIDIALYKHKMDSKLKEREQALEKHTAELKTNNEQLQREITKRKRAEEKIQQQSEFLNSVLDSLAHPLYVIDANDYTIKMANPAAKLDKLSENSTCYALTHKRDKPCGGVEHVCPLQEVKKTRKPVVVEHIHYDEDGNARNAEVHGYPIFDNEGNVIQMIECNFDITERKQVEEVLRESEEKWHSLTGNTDDTIVIADNNNVIQYINKTIPPTTPEGVIGRTIYEYVSKEHHDAMRKSLKKVYQTGEPDSYEVTLDMSRINPKLGTLWFNTKVVPIKTDSKISGVIMLATDITERKQAEHELEERMKELQCLYGIASIAERPEITLDELYQEVANILPPSWQYPEVTCARIVISGKEFKTENCRDTEWRQSSDIKVDGVKTGVVETCYLEERPEIDEGPFLKEERLLINAVAQRLGDITERKKAQQAQERLSQQLQTKVSELEALSHGIAHDLKSPMLSIEGFSRLLRADIQNQKTERVQEDIRLLESGVSKMQQFINRTLEYSRAGHLVKWTKNVPFGGIVKEVITEFTEQMSSVGATVSIAETFPRVYVDRMRIVQVLTNLIQNSIKYRDKTVPLKIEIGYRLSKDDVVFFVRDNGIGIDESETEKVFALFYRGTTDSEGSGAGLAIVKRIIEAHGGRIWVQAQQEKGTTMCFTLPQQSSTNKGDNNGEN